MKVVVVEMAHLTVVMVVELLIHVSIMKMMLAAYVVVMEQVVMNVLNKVLIVELHQLAGLFLVVVLVRIPRVQKMKVVVVV
jgi:hypothetical protein